MAVGVYVERYQDIKLWEAEDYFATEKKSICDNCKLVKDNNEVSFALIHALTDFAKYRNNTENRTGVDKITSANLIQNYLK